MASRPKPLTITVTHYGPSGSPSDILHTGTLEVPTGSDPRDTVKAWMETIGMDPEDEDDLSAILWS